MVALVLVISAEGVARADAGRDHGENASGSKKGALCACPVRVYISISTAIPLSGYHYIPIATEPRSLFAPAHRIRC